jgi:hypothetical protein
MLLRLQKNSMERMLRLAAAFKYEGLQAKAPADDSFKMTALLSVIKATSLKVLVVSLGYHSCYLVLRLLLRKDRPLAINAYYGFDTFSSPVYEMVNFSQVLNICSFVHQCNTFTSYLLLIVDMLRPHTAIFRCLQVYICS